MTGRRGLVVGLLVCVVGAALVLLADGRTWGSALLATVGGPRRHVAATGHEAVPALRALALAAVVLAAAVLAARRWLRRVVGVVLVALGAAVVVLALTSADDVAATLRAHAFAVRAAPSVGLSGWAVVAAAGGVLVVAAGVLTAVWGPRWPGMGSRYDPPAARRPAEPSATAWDALDRGEDPTL